MAVKERNTNAVCNDTLILRLFQYNENAPAAVEAIEKVEIYFLDPFNRTPDNPDGRRLIQTFTTVTVDAVGQYSVTVPLTSPLYVIGDYVDVWSIRYEADQCPGTREMQFSIGADKWYANSEPYLWSFTFSFRPFKFRKNERKYMIVEVTPNVPHISDLERYYADIATYPSLFITMALRCADCVPAEEDLRTVIDRQPVEVRNKRLGYYFLATTDLDCGIYDVWFELDLGGNTYISPKNQLQIFN